MDYSAHQQHQGYDPSAQPQQFYNQPTEDYYSYAYTNPQYVNTQPYPYHTVNVQPSQHEQQEPNPPGVTAPPPPQLDPNAYYPTLDYGAAAAAAGYAVGPQQGGVDVGVAMAHQPIVQSSYNDTATFNGVAPPGGAQTQVQIQSQTHLGPNPMPNFSGRPFGSRGRGHGRGRGRGRGRSLYKRTPTPAQDQTMFVQGGPQSYAPSFGPTPMPSQGQANSAPPSKRLWCEICKVECNSMEILNRHKSGKKHMKKLKSYEDSQNRMISGQVEQASISEPKPEVPFRPNQIQEYANQQLLQETLPSQVINEESKVAVEEAKPLWCELCKVDCNSIEILNKHKNGKKHLKKLKIFEELHVKKSQIGVQIEQIEPSAELLEQDNLPSQDNNDESNVAAEKQKVEELETAEETGKNVMSDHSEGPARGPKRKMRGGKVGRNTKPFRSKRPVEPPKPKEVMVPLICELCNVKCESQVVFQSHLVGKKHLLNAKRFLSQNETLGQEVLQILRHAIQTLQEQTAGASTSIAYPGLDGSTDLQASMLGTNLENARVEDISQPQLVPADITAPVMVNADGIENEGRSEDFQMGHLVSAETEIVASEAEPVVATETT